MAAKGWLANKSLCDSFAQRVGDGRESSRVNSSELLQLCVHAGAIGR